MAGGDVGRDLRFCAFAEQVKNWLWLLGIQATYELAPERARWTHAEYVVDLVPIDASHSRVMLTANGELLYATDPGPQTELGAKMLGDAIALWFGGPPELSGLPQGAVVAERGHRTLRLGYWPRDPPRLLRFSFLLKNEKAVLRFPTATKRKMPVFSQFVIVCG